MAQVKKGATRPRWGRRAGLAAILIAPLLLAGTASKGAQQAETDETAPPTLADVVTVEVVAPEGVVDDLRGGRLLVVIRNASETPVDVTALEGKVSGVYGDVDLTVREADRCEPEDPEVPVPCTIGDNEQALVPVDITVTELARTGKAPVAFDVELEHGAMTGNVIATAAISLGVFGESELLPLLQVPSILVLPGALVLVALTLLWRLGVREGLPAGGERPRVLVRSGHAVRGGRPLVASVVRQEPAHGLRLSRYSRGPGRGRNRGRPWGVIAILALRRAQKKKRIAEGDEAAVALAKLSKRKDDARLKTAVVSRDKDEKRVYQDAGDGGDMVVAGALRVTLDGNAADADKVEKKMHELRQAGHVAPLAKYLLGRVQAKGARVDWDSPPVKVVPEDYKPAGQTNLLEVDTE